MVAPPTATGPPPTDLVAPRAASPLQTVKLPHSKGKPTGRPLPGTGKPTGRPLLANVRLALVEPLQRANERQPPVMPQLAGLPAAEARVPSEAAPVDTTDPALAPLAVAVPAAWDHVAAEVFVAEVAVAGADERASCELLAPGF